jgi:hypothetical protein
LRGFDACEEAFEAIEARLPRLSGVFEPAGGFRQTLDTQVARAPLGRQLAQNRKPSRIAERCEGLSKLLRNKHVFLSKVI